MRLAPLTLLSAWIFAYTTIAHGGIGRSSCSQGEASRLLLTDAEYALKANTYWLDRPEFFSEVPMFELSGGLSIESGKTVPVYLTEYFIDELLVQSAGFPRPSGRQFTGHTYRYYRSMDKGSGRDHLIQAMDKSLPKEKRLHSVKGSGHNSYYSSAGVLGNFRRNGLQGLHDSFAEYIMAKQYESIGLPKVPHFDFVILPKELQPALKRVSEHEPNRYQLDSIAVQTHRLLEGGREGHDLVEISRETKISFASRFYLWNLGHGSLNKENLSGTGALVDMGHTGFVNPILAGEYRCTVCKGAEGSNFDEAMVGPLDHFFSNRPGAPSSMSFAREDSQLMKDLFSRIFTLISPEKDNAVADVLSPEDLALFEGLLRQRYPLTRDDEWRQWRRRGAALLIKLDEGLYRSPKADSASYFDEAANRTFSVRFLLQMSALKRIMGKAWYDQNVSEVLQNFSGPSSENYLRLLELFGRALAQIDPDPATLRKILFTEYRPMNVLMQEIAQDLENLPLEEIPGAARQSLERLRQPLVFEPTEWWEIIKKALLPSLPAG